jgi:hypothetical protein
MDIDPPVHLDTYEVDVSWPVASRLEKKKFHTEIQTGRAFRVQALNGKKAMGHDPIDSTAR